MAASTTPAGATVDKVTLKEASVSGTFCPDPDLLFITDMPIRSYNHYVELVEPAGKRACIKCCDDTNDCPLNQGAYFKSYPEALTDPYSYRHLWMPGGHSRQLL